MGRMNLSAGQDYRCRHTGWTCGHSGGRKRYDERERSPGMRFDRRFGERQRRGGVAGGAAKIS